MKGRMTPQISITDEQTRSPETWLPSSPHRPVRGSGALQTTSGLSRTFGTLDDGESVVEDEGTHASLRCAP